MQTSNQINWSRVESDRMVTPSNNRSNRVVLVVVGRGGNTMDPLFKVNKATEGGWLGPAVPSSCQELTVMKGVLGINRVRGRGRTAVRRSNKGRSRLDGRE